MTSELARRIAFTLGALFVYRLGSYIPLPGINPSFWEHLYNDHRGRIFGMLYTPSEGAIGQLSIFSLGVISYISAAVIIQLLSMVSSRLNAVARRGAAGRRTLRRYTLGLTLFLTAFQAFGVASGLERVADVVKDPGAFFLLSSTVTLMGGTVFLIWLSEQITARGIGNGLALILCAGIVTEAPRAIAATILLSQQGVFSNEYVALLALLSVLIVAAVAFMERARRHVPVEFAARQPGDGSIPPRPSHLSLKLNSAGLIPATVAPWLFFLPLTLAGLFFGYRSPWVAAAFEQIAPGHPGHMILSSVAIIILAFIYTAFVVDPEQTADSLKQYGGAIPGIGPGEATAEYVDNLVSRMTAIGAAYLALVFLLPEALITWANVSYYFGGASVLIVVCTVLDVEAQVRGMSLTGRGGEYA
jgi:preprotein translocase subunit SecY